MSESHGDCYGPTCHGHCAHPLSRLSHSGDELVTSTTLILTSTRERPCSARVGGRRRRPTRRTIAAAMVRDDAHDIRGQRRADEHGLRSHLRRVLRYETCSCWQSCAWGVIFGSTPRRSRRRSPAGRRRRRRPRGMRIRCARSRCARCTSGGARRAAASRYLRADLGTSAQHAEDERAPPGLATLHSRRVGDGGRIAENPVKIHQRSQKCEAGDHRQYEREPKIRVSSQEIA